MALRRQLRVLDGKEPVKGVKVAFATDDLKRVNQHFGSASRFAIFAVEPEESILVEVAEFGANLQDGNENKLLEKLVVLDSCAAVYCHAVGGSAVRQLLQMGVQPIKVPDGTGIPGLIHQLQRELRAGPTGWLARAYSRTRDKPADRFDDMEAEGWIE